MSRAPNNDPKLRPGPEGGKRDINRRARRSALEKAALALFLKRGIDAVTVDQIVARARMAKGNFYRYHESQAALVAALMAPLAEALEAAFSRAEQAIEHAEDGAQLREAYQGLAAELAGAALSHSDHVRLFLQEARGPATPMRRPIAELGRRISEGALALTRAAQAHGLIRSIDPRISSLAVIGAVERLLHAVLAGEDLGDPLAAAEALIGLVLDGIRGPARPS